MKTVKIHIYKFIKMLKNTLGKSGKELPASEPSEPSEPSEEKVFDVNDYGIFVGGPECHGHHQDHGFADRLIAMFKMKNIKSVADFGCGTGAHVAALNNAGITAEGFDGNPETEKLSNEHCSILNLAEPFNLNKKFDFVLSLEVAEHIPEEYETVYLDNIERHVKTKDNALTGIIISWAPPGQAGLGHVNCRPAEYVREKLTSRGFKVNNWMTRELKNASNLRWIKNNVIAFTR